jgi:MoxR-like ATPase
MMKDPVQHRETPTMTIEELIHFQMLTDRVVIEDEVYNAILKIRNELWDEGIRPSDRRFKQSLSVLQARALIRGRKVVLVEDIVILENVLWETICQKETVSVIVHRHAEDAAIQALDSIQSEANEVLDSIMRDKSAEAGMEATQKMGALVADLNKMKGRFKGREMEIDALLIKVKSMEQEILNAILEPMYFHELNDKKEMGMTAGIYYKM